jgi:hypothetical protein
MVMNAYVFTVKANETEFHEKPVKDIWGNESDYTDYSAVYLGEHEIFRTTEYCEYDDDVIYKFAAKMKELLKGD